MAGISGAALSNSSSQGSSNDSSNSVDDAVDTIEDRLSESWTDWDVTNSDLKDISQTIDNLEPDEKNAVVAELSDQTLSKWGDELDGTNGGLSHDERTDLYNSLATDLDANQLSRVYNAFGEDHQPDLAEAVDRHATPETRLEFVDTIQKQALQNADVPEGLTDEQKALYLDLAQLGLDVVGIVEPTPFADGSNTVISLFRGDFLGAGLSAVGIIPYLGDLAKVGKLGKWSSTVSNVLEMAAKSPDFAKVVEPLLRKVDDAIGAIPDSVMRNLPEGVQDALGSARSKIDDFNTRGDAPVSAAGRTTRQYDSLEDFNAVANGPAAARANQVLEFGNYRWTTDSLGRVESAEGVVDLTKHGRRTNGVSTTDIGREGVDGDIGFHLIGDQFNGPINRVNVVPGNGTPIDLPDGTHVANLNQGRYASQFENPVRELAQNPNNAVEIRVESVYRGNNTSARPDEFIASYRVNGGDWVDSRFINRAGG